MTAAKLRAAASLMRERATSCADGWDRKHTPQTWHETYWVDGDYDQDAPHIASWHPVVALAVADWLDLMADDFDQWHGVRSACRELDANDGETPEGFRCDCSFKDCYEHGKWHNCVHGMPNTDAALAVADVYMRSAS